MKGFPAGVITPLLPSPQQDDIFLMSIKDRLLEQPTIHHHPFWFQKFLSGDDDWKEVIHIYPLLELEKVLGVHELARLYFLGEGLFSYLTEKEIRQSPKYWLIEKIRVGSAKWGNYSDISWHEIETFYNEFVSMRIDLKDFSVSLDWTTGYNMWGYSTYADIFLDGTFAYLVHYKGEHVMTIGFSPSDKGKILIQQIQLAKKKGNRFLYHLPVPYMKWAIDLLRNHFSGRDVYLVTGESLALSIVRQYCDGAKRKRDSFFSKRRFMSSDTSRNEEILRELREIRNEHKIYIKKAVEFRRNDFDRLIRLYGGSDGFPTMTRNNRIFRLVNQPA